MESNQVRHLELRSRALELEMRQHRVQMGRMQVELREADACMRRSSERFGDIKRQLLTVQESRGRSGSPAEVLYQAKSLAERLSHAAKVLREQTDVVTAMRGKLAESQRQAALREMRLSKLDERARAITERVAQGAERAQTEEILEVSAQTKAQALANPVARGTALAAEAHAEGVANSEVRGVMGQVLAELGAGRLQGGAALCADSQEASALGAALELVCQSDVRGGQLTAPVIESGEQSMDAAAAAPAGESSQNGVASAIELVTALGSVGEHKGAEKVSVKCHQVEQEECGADTASATALGVGAQYSSAQAQLAAMAQAGMDMQRQQHGQRHAQTGSGSANVAVNATRSFSEAVSPGLEKQVELLQSWDKFSGQGVGFNIKLDSGKSMGVEISAGPAGGVQVVLEPENNRDRHSLWQQRGEIIEALQEAGCEVKGVTVRGRK